MSVGRWLLVHSFSIFLVTLLILGYYFRDELQLGEVYDQLLSGGKQTLEQVASDPESASASEEVSQQPSLSVPPAPSRSTVEQPASERLESTASADGANQRPPATVEPTIQPRDEPTWQDKSLTFLRSTPTVSRSIIELDDLLYQARKAYWDRDYQLAIAYYQQLIEDDGDNPDYIGELGNIYYAINDFDNAAQQYYQAAIILIAKGRPAEARRLVSPVTAMNRDLGDQLQRRLTETPAR